MNKSSWVGLEPLYIWPSPIPLKVPLKPSGGDLRAAFSVENYGTKTFDFRLPQNGAEVSHLHPSEALNPEDLNKKLKRPATLTSLNDALGETYLEYPVMLGNFGDVSLTKIEKTPSDLQLSFTVPDHQQEENRIVLRFPDIHTDARPAFLALVSQNLRLAGLSDKANQATSDGPYFRLYADAGDDSLLVVLDNIMTQTISISLDVLRADSTHSLSDIWALLSLNNVRILCDASGNQALKDYVWPLGSDWLGWETSNRRGFVSLSPRFGKKEVIRFRIGIDTNERSEAVALSIRLSSPQSWGLKASTTGEPVEDNSSSEAELNFKRELHENQTLFVSDMIEFSVDSAPKPRLSICIDLGASAIAAAFGFSTSAPVPIKLGERQKRVDSNHAEIDELRLVSSAVALHHEGSLQIGWARDTSWIGYETVSVPTSSGPDLFLQSPHPSHRDMSLCSFRTSVDVTRRDGLVIIPPVGASPYPVWACEGYKQAICHPSRDDQLPITLSHPSFDESQVMIGDVFEASLIGLMTNHIAPILGKELDNPTRRNALDLSKTQLTLTYPSGLPQSTQDRHYRQAGRKALQQLLGTEILDDEAVNLISEARATAYQAAHNPPYLRSPREGAPYPGRGKNFLIVADIGKSTADFCIATFNATGTDGINHACDFETFQTVHEFGTTLGGRTLDEALRNRLESVFDNNTAGHDKKWVDSDRWRNHQDETVSQSKARWSSDKVKTDPTLSAKYGAVEIDLAWSQHQKTVLKEDLAEEMSQWLSRETLVKITSMPNWEKLEAKINEHASSLFSSEPEEVKLYPQEGDRSHESASTIAPTYEVLLTNCAADGERLLVTTGLPRQWRLVLRGHYDWLMAKPEDGSRPAKPWPHNIIDLTSKICINLAKSIPELCKDPSLKSVTGPIDHVWLLVTGRTTLYRAFRSESFEPDKVNDLKPEDFKPEQTVESAVLTRLEIDSTSRASSAEALKSIVVDGALALAQRGIYHQDQPSVLSLGQIKLESLDDRDWPNKPWPMRSLERNLNRLECYGDLVTGPPFRVEKPAEELTEFPELFRGLFRRINSIDHLEYSWVEGHKPHDGQWIFYSQQPTNSNLPALEVFRLTPEGHISD